MNIRLFNVTSKGNELIFICIFDPDCYISVEATSRSARSETDI